MRRIDETYKWRNPTIIDKHPELIEFLKTKPKYIDAWALRKVIFWRHEQFTAMERNRLPVPRKELDLYAPNEPHLKLVE